MQDFPAVPKSVKYEGKVKPDKVDWDKVINEAVEAGKEVPEIDWVKPGADAAVEVLGRSAPGQLSLHPFLDPHPSSLLHQHNL